MSKAFVLPDDASVELLESKTIAGAAPDPEPDTWLEEMLQAMADHVARGGRIVFRTPEQYAELQRTRITPGADPRAQWDEGEDPRDTRGLSADENDAGYSQSRARAFRKARRRYTRSERRSLFEQNDGPNGGLSWASETYADGRPGSLRYVPRDVARWRDPEHREALTQRARAHAALPLARPSAVDNNSNL